MSSSTAGAVGLTTLFVGTILYVPWIFAMRAVAIRKARSGRVPVASLHAWLEKLSIGLVMLGLANVFIALPLLHPDFAAPRIVREAALPVAYLAVAVGAAMRLLTTGITEGEISADPEAALGE